MTRVLFSLPGDSRPLEKGETVKHLTRFTTRPTVRSSRRDDRLPIGRPARFADAAVVAAMSHGGLRRGPSPAVPSTLRRLNRAVRVTAVEGTFEKLARESLVFFLILHLSVVSSSFSSRF